MVVIFGSKTLIQPLIQFVIVWMEEMVLGSSSRMNFDSGIHLHSID